MTGILFLVAVIAAVAAVIFFAQSRSSGTALLALKDEQLAERKATEGDRASLREAQAELKQRSQQLLELRERLTEQKKRVDAKAQKTQPRGVREAELEEDLTHARKLAEEAHAGEQEARKLEKAARAALEAKDAELRRAQEKVRELSSRPAAAGEGAPSDGLANAALLSAQSDARRSEEKARAALARLAELESQLGAARERELKQREDGRKAKGRAETNNRAYLIAKGELELIKERLGQAERRLWQAGIALPKPPPAGERPKATGPASADRPREEIPAGALALESQPADPEAQAVASESAAAVESAGSAVIAAASEPGSSEPQAVSPVRRRPPQAEASKA